MHQNGTAAALTPASDTPDLSAALLAAETTGQLPADIWPALRDLLLATSDPAITGAVAPLRQLIAARQALTQARHALDAGYAAVTAAGDDPTTLADAASQLAALADDVAGRAQQLAALVPS